MKIAQSYELLNERMMSVPSNFNRSIGRTDTAIETDLGEYLRSLKSETPNWSFRWQHKTVTSVLPVILSIKKEGTDYLVENETLKIFVAAESLDQALMFFSEQVVHFYDHYRNLTPDRVTGEAERLRELYCAYFNEVIA